MMLYVFVLLCVYHVNQDQYWLDRLKDGSYPGDEALDQIEKYLEITTSVVRNVINNRITSDQTPEERDRTIKFMKSIAKTTESINEYAERSSLVYPQCIRNGTQMKPESDTDFADHTNSTHNQEDEEEKNDTVMDWDTLAASVDSKTTEPPIVDINTFTQTTDNPTPTPPDVLNLILAKLNTIDAIHSRLDALEGKTPRATPSQTSGPPAPKPKPKPMPKPNTPQTTHNTPKNPAGVKWSEIASKPPSKVPEVNASNISNAIKRDISTQAQAKSDDKNYIVHFKTLPLVQPNPETIFVAMRDCLNARNRNLGAGKLTRVRWSLKASLHLSFSNNASIIEHAIPWLMEHLQLPEYTFGPEVPWSRLVVTNVPTGMGGSLQRMRNREEVTQLLKEAFPDSTQFKSLKLTLAPDWIADPARLQAEGRTASSVAFSFEDAGGLASARLLNSPTIHIFNRRCEVKKFNLKPILQTCTKCASGIGARFSDITPIHRDIIALDLTILDSQLTIINCYPHGTDHKKTCSEITQIVIPQDRPCIMAGDFNMHHPEWALINSKWEKRHPNQTERVFATYAEYHDLHIMNNTHLPTHYIPRSPASNAIIDLTLLNSRAVDAWPNFNWEVETPVSGRSLGSDHEAITWSIGPHDQAEPIAAMEKAPGYPIDPSCQDEWIGFYAQHIHEADLPKDPETAEDADRITGGILSAMSNASRLTFEENRKKKTAERNKNYKGKKPKKKGNTGARSPWWTEECSQAVHNLKHNPENKDKDQLRGALRGAIRRARRSRGEKILAEISTDRVFDCLKWFQGNRRALIPPIKDPNGGITATHPADKARNFGKQFFPAVNKTPISLEPLGIKSTPKRPHHYITEEEISRSLSKTSNRSTPGAFGSNYRLLKWAFTSSPDHFVSLFNVCLRIGYHPTSLRNCIIAPIPKPRRQDMSIPKNYRPIALLETLSKLLEKVITNRITHEAGKHNLLSHSQFGGKDITSCTDAGLCMIHDIRSAWARKKSVSLLTLDISGYFNNVNHERLIYTMDRLGYSNEICNWLKSYLSHRSAQFCIDGALCNPIQLPNVGIPQGSPLSPILSSIYSLPILASTADLQASSFGYIDDFTILAFSDSHEQNINIIQDITNNVNDIAIKLGLEFELPKSEQKSLLEPLRKTQNLGLRWILGAFRTTPVRCMEHLASIPPIHILCQKHIESLAAKLRSIPRTSELAKRLPASWDSSTLPSRNKAIPKDPIQLIASHTKPNAELVTPYLTEPHLPTKPFGDQLVIEATNPNPNTSAEEFIDKCKTFTSKAESCPQSIIGYSDGHADEPNGKPECSIGLTIWTDNREIYNETKNLGPRSNIYDAEMLGIALCLRRASNIAIQNNLSHVYICCDNQSAVKSIYKLDRHPAQYASRIFRNHVSTFLTDHPNRKITIKWIPGHKGIGHNGRADELAKEGAKDPITSPFDRTITWIKQGATKSASTSWAKIWEKHVTDRENSNTFIPRIPSLTLHPIFNRTKTARSIECRLVQLLTGHCFLGEYRARFHPDVDPSCQCGESTQTFLHTTLFCPSTEGHRAILRLEAVVEFIAKSGIGKPGGPPATAPDL
ncbi:unnamed protein product [Rhizoctonia solani]|uniref:RNA-directed DNA polymerase from transposon BS n=1 Tax=Rhizoctonia solani TaxID=456999 RepID=A0A8H3BR43_9AGAM|nr:unnamed protein product [Rhizoctonia solani]